MSNFLKAASKQVVDVKSFLRETASGNTIKYTMEKATKHMIYIPYIKETVIDDETGNEVERKSLVAISLKLHEWTTADNKFKSVVCMDGTVYKDDDGNIINDGTCPFCDRVNDAWDIYNYRLDVEEARCKLSGPQREEHMKKIKSTLAHERKADKARPYVYLLIVKYSTNDKCEPVIGDDGLPQYQLKVMKLARSTVEKLEQQMTNAGTELTGSEIIIEYPNVDDLRLLGSQRTMAPVFTERKLTNIHHNLIDKINQDVAKFDWSSIESAFPELKEIPTETAKVTVASLFEQWDNYKKELITNPTAKYLEYVVEAPATTPNLGGVNMNSAPQIPNIPMPNVADANKGIGNMPIPPVAPVMPGEAVNNVFQAAPINI